MQHTHIQLPKEAKRIEKRCTIAITNFKFQTSNGIEHNVKCKMHDSHSYTFKTVCKRFQSDIIQYGLKSWTLTNSCWLNWTQRNAKYSIKISKGQANTFSISKLFSMTPKQFFRSTLDENCHNFPRKHCPIENGKYEIFTKKFMRFLVQSALIFNGKCIYAC